MQDLLLISLIQNFTALRRVRPAPLVAFVDRVSPFSPYLCALEVGGEPGQSWGTCSISRLGWEGGEKKKKSKLNGSDNLKTFLPAAAQHSP